MKDFRIPALAKGPDDVGTFFIFLSFAKCFPHLPDIAIVIRYYTVVQKIIAMKENILIVSLSCITVFVSILTASSALLGKNQSLFFPAAPHRKHSCHKHCPAQQAN